MSKKLNKVILIVFILMIISYLITHNDRGIMNEKKLIKGNHYYEVSFYDQKLTIPHITTLIYIGKNLRLDDNKPTIDKWHFQDPESYLIHGAFTDIKGRIKREVYSLETLESIYDDQSLIDTIKLLQNLKKKGLYLAQIRPNQLHMYQHDNDRGIMDEKKFIKGNHYYKVFFYDQKLTIPHITTLIYIGKNILLDDNEPTIDKWYFQDPESYLAHGAFKDFEEDFKEKIERGVYIFETLESIFDDQSFIDEIKLL